MPGEMRGPFHGRVGLRAALARGLEWDKLRRCAYAFQAQEVAQAEKSGWRPNSENGRLYLGNKEARGRKSRHSKEGWLG